MRRPGLGTCLPMSAIAFAHHVENMRGFVVIARITYHDRGSPKAARHARRSKHRYPDASPAPGLHARALAAGA